MVYVFHAIGTKFYKIGFANGGASEREIVSPSAGKAVITRLHGCQTGCPHILIVEAVIFGKNRYGENELHKEFANNIAAAENEWFRLSESEIDMLINQEKNNHPVWWRKNSSLEMHNLRQYARRKGLYFHYNFTWPYNTEEARRLAMKISKELEIPHCAAQKFLIDFEP